jgi:hypothetical protein
MSRPDCFDSSPNVRCVGHVQGQGGDPRIRVGQRLACAGIYPLRPSSEGFFDERAPETAIGPGHQHRSVCDWRTRSQLGFRHTCLQILVKTDG